jgi:hypothetical protein
MVRRERSGEEAAFALARAFNPSNVNRPSDCRRANFTLRQGRNLALELPDCDGQAVDLRSLTHPRRSPSHQKGDTMLSALVETVGALGILASVAAKIAELRKEYRRCKKVNANKKAPPKRGR